jgi:hypothetical protein
MMGKPVKKNKKRRKIDELNHLSNLTGFSSMVAGSNSKTIAENDCLTEMMMVQQSQQSQEGSDNTAAKVSTAIATSQQLEFTNNLQQKACHHHGLSSSLDTTIDEWNRSFHAWAGGSTSNYPIGLLPKRIVINIIKTEISRYNDFFEQEK